MGIVVDPGQQSPGHALMEFSFQWGKADNKQIKKKKYRECQMFICALKKVKRATGDQGYWK